MLCDVFARVTNKFPGDGGDKKIGMPILYYKADVSNTAHDFAEREDSVYDCWDNIELLRLNAAWDQTRVHSLLNDPTGDYPGEGELFYEITKNKYIVEPKNPRPVNEEGYILISAGYDGLYGTDDDIYNFSE